MVKKQKNEFVPDYATPPGETLEEILQERDMTQTDFAQRVGLSLKVINEIVHGKAPITHDTAHRFERVLGVPASFWNKREMRYREILARIKEEVFLSKCVEWVEKFNIKKMIEYDYIEPETDKKKLVKSLLSFFSIASPDEWDVILANVDIARRSAKTKCDEYALSAWLRRGQILASKVECNPYSKEVLKSLVPKMRELTLSRVEHFKNELQRLGAEAGVAIVFVPELPKMGTYGATYWLSSTKPVVQLSLFRKMNDILWFTFFHEIAHILKEHTKSKTIIEYKDKDKNQIEIQADNFAADILIPKKDYRAFIETGDFSEHAITNFASKLNIASGVIVGRLQYDGHVPWRSKLNSLKERFEWVKSL